MSNHPKVRLGIVGLGKMGQYHLTKALGCGGAELVGVYDPQVDKIAAKCRSLGVNAFSNLDELLFETDAVVIAAPTPAHFDLVERALNVGTHVLVEKPITETVAQAESLKRLAQQHSLVLQVGFLERFRFAALWGSVSLPSFRYLEADRLAVALGREACEVDVVQDLMIHDLDLVLSLARSEVKDVWVSGAKIVSDKWDTANVTIQFENGKLAQLRSSRVAAQPVREIKLFAESTYFRVDLANNGLQIHERQGPLKLGHRYLENQTVDALESQLSSFLASVANGTEPLVSAEDGVRALRLVEQIRAKLEGNRVLSERGPEVAKVVPL